MCNRAGQSSETRILDLPNFPPSGLLAAVRCFRRVGNTTGSCVASDSGQASDQTGADGYTMMFEWRLREKNMPSLEMDRLATEAMQCWAEFQEGLSSDKQKDPLQRFRAFWAVTKRYAEVTRSDPLIHTSVARAVNGLLDFLEAERKCVPGDVLSRC
jgi:hypothetical protein